MAIDTLTSTRRGAQGIRAVYEFEIRRVPSAQSVEHEVVRPHLIRPSRGDRPWPARRHTPSGPPLRHLAARPGTTADRLAQGSSRVRSAPGRSESSADLGRELAHGGDGRRIPRRERRHIPDRGSSHREPGALAAARQAARSPISPATAYRWLKAARADVSFQDFTVSRVGRERP